MSLNDPLANALSVINNYEKSGKQECRIKPQSRVIKEVLRIMNEKHHLGSSEEEEDGRGGYLKVNLLGKINRCGAVKPRYFVKNEDYEKFEQRYLPAKDFGILIISTSKGIMSHEEAKEKRIGGVLLAYCY
ncbi:MAG: 30S ribosomal protein S8 [Candidatus Woesearchaeota archaeon]